QLTAQGPGLFGSSYFTLAALDGAPPSLRNEASFAVDVDSGGRAARMIVLPKGDVIDPATTALRGRLDRMAQQISAGDQATAYVAGEAAVNLDYRNMAMSRLVLLVLLLTLVAYVVLVMVLRSLLLPLFAVA